MNSPVEMWLGSLLCGLAVALRSFAGRPYFAARAGPASSAIWPTSSAGCAPRRSNLRNVSDRVAGG